ncbi:MAG TPA: MBOAT family O-acyltransferase [Bacteroidia bacterium]|nr:MBOAT family O-acyltransferase [Bacteroidia bacterium]
MVFSSIVFLVYFLPIFLFVYYLADKKYKNVVILLFSIFFYSWGAPKFIFVILGTTFLDFFLVKWMYNSSTRLHRRLLLTLSVSINLGLLFYFKYSGFFIENVNLALTHIFHAHALGWTKLVLPLGISFYTFETITYVVDVYRGVHKPLNNFWNYQLYIILFPKLIAGPIIRYNELADQITDRSQNETTEDRLMGFYRFIIGLSKKVLIANQMGALADSVFQTNYSTLSTYAAWMGILAYTFQIYFDFSGYSDMAIGIARMIGFKFPENFNNPYVSQSITEFWRRWHMLLGRWMKNYLYIPLGGNRVDSKLRLYFNLWFVFLISGLWHGASWNFVIWGAYHGTFLALERAFLLKVYDKIGRLFRTILTFLIVVVGWVFFRVEKFHDAIHYIKRMFAFDSKVYALQPDPAFYSMLAIAAFFAFFACFKWTQKLQDAAFFGNYTNSRHILAAFLSLALFILAVGNIAATGFNPFIYFRF